MESFNTYENVYFIVFNDISFCTCMNYYEDYSENGRKSIARHVYVIYAEDENLCSVFTGSTNGSVNSTEFTTSGSV